MEGLYIALVVFGGGYYLISTLLGHHGDASGGDHHGLDFFHHDGGGHLHSGDGDHPAHEHADSDEDSGEIRVNPFSLRNLALFSAAFGAFGYITQIIFALGLLAGILVGTTAGLVSVYAMFRLTVWMMRQAGSSHVREDDYWGVSGRAITTLRPGQIGTVSILVRNTRETWSASPEGDDTIPAGSLVAVRRKEGSHLIVIPGEPELDD